MISLLLLLSYVLLLLLVFSRNPSIFGLQHLHQYYVLEHTEYFFDLGRSHSFP